VSPAFFDVSAADVEVHPGIVVGLLRHSFPRDVDELEEILGASLARCDGPVLLPAHLPPARG
jgi:hypothetical protein